MKSNEHLKSKQKRDNCYRNIANALTSDAVYQKVDVLAKRFAISNVSTEATGSDHYDAFIMGNLSVADLCVSEAYGYYDRDSLMDVLISYHQDYHDFVKALSFSLQETHQ